jgi:hypothetical protein
MKKHKLAFGITPVFVLFLSMASCKKMDLKQEGLTPEAAIPVAAVAPTAAPAWKGVNFNAAPESGAFSGVLADNAISAAVASKGLVLVYANNGGSITSLPFTDKATGTSWYYQVAAGDVRISYETKGELTNAPSFQYFVVSPDQLKTLETKGTSKMELLDMSYEAAQALLSH